MLFFKKKSLEMETISIDLSGYKKGLPEKMFSFNCQDFLDMYENIQKIAIEDIPNECQICNCPKIDLDQLWELVDDLDIVHRMVQVMLPKGSIYGMRIENGACVSYVVCDDTFQKKERKVSSKKTKKAVNSPKPSPKAVKADDEDFDEMPLPSSMVLKYLEDCMHGDC